MNYISVGIVLWCSGITGVVVIETWLRLQLSTGAFVSLVLWGVHNHGTTSMIYVGIMGGTQPWHPFHDVFSLCSQKG